MFCKPASDLWWYLLHGIAVHITAQAAGVRDGEGIRIRFPMFFFFFSFLQFDTLLNLSVYFSMRGY